MVGDITGPRSQGVNNSVNKNGSSAAAGQGSSAVVQSSKDAESSNSASVQLSGSAQLLPALEAKAKISSGFDDAKIAEIKAAIADGSYHVNPQRLAEQILALDSELFG